MKERPRFDGPTTLHLPLDDGTGEVIDRVRELVGVKSKREAVRIALSFTADHWRGNQR